MVTYDEKTNAVAKIVNADNFTKKATYAFYNAVEAFERLSAESCMLNRSAMAMYIANLTLYLEAIQMRHKIPYTVVDEWIDTFVREQKS